ncbi:sugar ABC transporter ATP-binding protein [Bacillus kexueae]|uniref:sugar ABC transporter ATP-binding protein n=1 Tax=Aeribacillus kexueae TaxID=2078952 RepID=UPI001FAFD625|nr:sugar ABC transporter ATP-binding protein [Bacillus kexueae]
MALTMTEIHKSYNHNHVLKGVNFSVRKGEIHALLGMNGAGKSTLMKILSGQTAFDSGSISIDEKEVSFRHPQDAKRAGIGMVVQEVDAALFPNLTIAENVLSPSSLSSVLSWKKLNKEAKKRLKTIGLCKNPRTFVNECTLPEKQLILIAKVLSEQAQYIILDEPTASLSEAEASRLFAQINQLKERGISTIFISHRLDEVVNHCDRVTILRDGQTVFAGEVKTLSVEKMIQHMVGNDVAFHRKTATFKQAETQISIQNLVIKDKGTTIDLDVKKGEIIGIGGLAGSGKTELAESIFGLNGGVGTWTIRNEVKKVRSPYDALNAGICLIPEERRKQGLFIHDSSTVNLTVRTLSKLFPNGFINRKKEAAFASEWLNRLHVSPNDPNLGVLQFSGGNQQKIVIGKWLTEDHNVFIFDEPTKGIDIKAKQEIFELIHSLAQRGKSVLYFTSEWEELMQIADRIVILQDGKMVKSLSNEEATYDSLLYYATMGGNKHGTNRTSENEAILAN